MSQYLKPADITSNLVVGVDLNQYMDEADEAIVDLAEVLGVEKTDIVVPVHFQVRHYGVNYLMLRVCEDKMGTCSPDSLQFDKYFQLSDYYRKRVADIRNRISVEMVLDQVNAQRDRSIMTGVLFRG